MKQKNKIGLLLLLLVIMLSTACNKNFYTTKAKGTDCGCPNKKGL